MNKRKGWEGMGRDYKKRVGDKIRQHESHVYLMEQFINMMSSPQAQERIEAEQR